MRMFDFTSQSGLLTAMISLGQYVYLPQQSLPGIEIIIPILLFSNIDGSYQGKVGWYGEENGRYPDVIVELVAIQEKD